MFPDAELKIGKLFTLSFEFYNKFPHLINENILLVDICRNENRLIPERDQAKLFCNNKFHKIYLYDFYMCFSEIIPAQEE